MQIKTDEELWEVLGTLEKFNKFTSDLTEQILQKVLLAVPALVIHHIKNEHSYNKLKDSFFLANPELINFKPVVAQQLNIVAAENPGWSIDQVFTQAGIKSKQVIRKSLEAKNEATV